MALVLVVLLPVVAFLRLIKTHFSVKDKPQYHGASGGLEYEAAWSLGADTGVDDIDALTYVNFICNEDGLDPITHGCTVAAAMEMFEAGVIGLDETDGIDLRFGSAESLSSCYRSRYIWYSFWKSLGHGFQNACAKSTINLNYPMTVKGSRIPSL